MGKTKTDPESNLRKLFGIHKESPVEDESRFVHSNINSLPVNLLELFPLSGNDDGLCILASLECRLADGHLLFDCITLSETSSTSRKRYVLFSRGTRGLASWRSAQICSCSTWGSYIFTKAFSDWKSLIKVMAADSRVSPVSALKAKPKTAMR